MRDARTSPETTGVVVGNVTDKYTGNPVVRRLTNRFLSRLDTVLDAVGPTTRPVLEVGTGEGVVGKRLSQRYDAVVALDLPDPVLRAHWLTRPGPTYLHADATRLPFPADMCDVVLAIEVLEHVDHPRAVLRELVRVSRRDLVLSVPREPLFRLGNLAAGRYVRAAGNTPGHVNHWSTRAFAALVSEVAAVQSVSTPFPWTLVHARRP